MKAERKHYSMKSLVDCARAEFANITDKSKRSQYPLPDCLLSGLAMFYLKIESLLQYLEDGDKMLLNNIQNMYKIAVPSDTHFRVRLDDVNPIELQAVYDALIMKLQRGKILEKFRQTDGFYLVAIDGTGYFSSNKIHCDNCCIKQHKSGKITYYHQVVSAVLVDPDKKQVLPLAVEPIIKQDGHTKNDCEHNATIRLLRRLKQSHRRLKIVVLMDALFADSTILNLLKELHFGYIITAKQMKHLYDQFLYDGTKEHVQCKTENIEQDFKFANGLELFATHPEIHSNYLEYQETTKKTYCSSWITDQTITVKNVQNIMRYGRARWHIENETYNTLKNQGYHFEHNYGHGYKNLSVVLCNLMFIAFLIDQIQEYCGYYFKKALATCRCKKHIWNKIRAFMTIVAVESWEDLYKIIVHHVVSKEDYYAKHPRVTAT